MMNWKCNFSFKHYFEVLDYAKKTYHIGPIKQISSFKNKNRFILLRHDIDFSLDFALKLAEAEAKHGLKSTYFVLLHSPFYNAISKSNLSSIIKISKLGHEIGLHYDTSFFSSSGKSITKQLRFEIDILSKIIGTKVTSIAQHNVTISPKVGNKTLNKFKDIRLSKQFKPATYLSDSTHNWRDGCMCKYVGQVNKIQILTHPIWWSVKHRTLNTILNEFERNQKRNFMNELNDHKRLQRIYLKKLNYK